MMTQRLSGFVHFENDNGHGDDGVGRRMISTHYAYQSAVLLRRVSSSPSIVSDSSSHDDDDDCFDNDENVHPEDNGIIITTMASDNRKQHGGKSLDACLAAYKARQTEVSD